MNKSTIAASTAVAQPAGGMVRREVFLWRMAQPPAFDPAAFCRGESGLVRDRVPGARFRRLRGAAAEAAVGPRSDAIPRLGRVIQASYARDLDHYLLLISRVLMVFDLLFAISGDNHKRHKPSHRSCASLFHSLQDRGLLECAICAWGVSANDTVVDL